MMTSSVLICPTCIRGLGDDGFDCGVMNAQIASDNSQLDAFAAEVADEIRDRSYTPVIEVVSPDYVSAWPGCAGGLHHNKSLVIHLEEVRSLEPPVGMAYPVVLSADSWNRSAASYADRAVSDALNAERVAAEEAAGADVWGHAEEPETPGEQAPADEDQEEADAADALIAEELQTPAGSSDVVGNVVETVSGLNPWLLAGGAVALFLLLKGGK